MIELKRRYEETEKLLKRLGIEIDARAMVRNISVAQMQLVELARAVSYDSDIIIMDEHTSALTLREIEVLYRIVRSLNQKGVAIIFISHKLEEIFEICTSVTVLRDGCCIDTLDCSKVDEHQLMNMIAGRELSTMYTKNKKKRAGRCWRCETSPAGNLQQHQLPGANRRNSWLLRLAWARAAREHRAIFGLDNMRWAKSASTARR